MKYLIPFLLALVSGCGASNPAKPNEESKAIGNANQHVAAAVTLAIFYCEKSRWPNGVEEMKSYSEIEELPLPVKLDWAWLARPEVSWSFTEQVILRTPAGNTPQDIAVSSVNKPPKCDGGSIVVDTAISLGE